MSVPLIVRGDFKELGYFDLLNTTSRAYFRTQMVKSNIAFVGNLPPGSYMVVRTGTKTVDGLLEKPTFTKPFQINGGIYYLGEYLMSGKSFRQGILITNVAKIDSSITNLANISNIVFDFHEWKNSMIFDISKDL